MIQWKKSLEELLKAIPPPPQPTYVEGPLLDPSMPALPADHEALIRAYGSGEFAYDEIGCVIEVFNPRDPWHMNQVKDDYEVLREYRVSEGNEYMPYPIYPEVPGVMISGWNHARDFWFWHVQNADCDRWPTVFYGDMQDAFEFPLPMVVFMQKLFFGEISRRDLSFAEPNFESKGFEFRPTFRTGSHD